MFSLRLTLIKVVVVVSVIRLVSLRIKVTVVGVKTVEMLIVRTLYS